MSNLINKFLLQINNYDFYLKIILIFVLFYIIYNLDLKINVKNKKLCLIIPVYEINNKYINDIHKNLESKGYNFKIILLKYKLLEEMNTANIGNDINLAILLNNDSDYYCIQDCSIIPSKLDDYNFTNYPRYTSMLIEKNNAGSSIIGGSFIINKEDLIKTNGFINDSKKPLEDMKNILNKGFIRYLNCDINNKCEVNTNTKKIVLKNNLNKEEYIQNIRNSINTVIIDEYNIKNSLHHIKNDLTIYTYNLLNYVLKLLGIMNKVRNVDYLKNIKNINNNEHYLHNNGLDQLKLDNIENKIKNITSLYNKDNKLHNIYLMNIQ